MINIILLHISLASYTEKHFNNRAPRATNVDIRHECRSFTRRTTFCTLDYSTSCRL